MVNTEFELVTPALMLRFRLAGFNRSWMRMYTKTEREHFATWFMIKSRKMSALRFVGGERLAVRSGARVPAFVSTQSPRLNASLAY